MKMIYQKLSKKKTGESIEFKKERSILSNDKDLEFAIVQHKQVPPNWYQESLKVDILQRFWHKTRFAQAKKLIEPVKGLVLDIGCADGVFSYEIYKKSKAKKLIGIDVLKSSVDWANHYWKNKSNMRFFVGDAHSLKFPSNYFEAIFCNEVLEHVVNPVGVLKGMRRVLKKDGYGIFLVPSDNDLFKIVWWLWLHFYPRGWVWKDTHIQTFKSGKLAQMCKKAGFKVEENRFFNLGMLNIVKVRKI